MSIFAKLFNFAKSVDYKEDYQVLVTIYNTINPEQYFLSEETLIEGIKAKIDHEFKQEEDRAKAFHEYDETRAKAFLFQMKITIDDATGKNKINGTSFTLN